MALPLIASCVLVGSVFTVALALQRVRAGQFYTETPLLWLVGSYVWGDAVILSPLWALGSGAALLVQPQGVTVLRWLLIYYFLRSFFEVIYWLNHQAARDTFVPPLLRRVAFLDATAAAIWYQLIHFAVLVICACVWLTLPA